jgi:hypothetical protein
MYEADPHNVALGATLFHVPVGCPQLPAAPAHDRSELARVQDVVRRCENTSIIGLLFVGCDKFIDPN